MNPWEKYQSQTGPWQKYAAPQPEEQSPQEPVDFSWRTMLGNIPASAGQAFNDMVTPILHPMDTAKAIGNVALGGVQKLIPGEQESEVYADAVGKAIMDRYGSMDAFKKTVMDDPVGALMDISGVVNAVGGVARLGTRTGSLANRAATAVQRAGAAIDPVNIATSPLKAAVGQLTPRGLPNALYEGAAKFPPVSVSRPTREKIIETALNNRIMPTGSGIDRATVLLEQFDARIDDLIKAADASGQKIPKGALYSELKGLVGELKGGAAEAENLSAYTRAIRNLNKRLRKEPTMLAPSRVQEFKVKTYRDINWKNTPDTRTAATNETYKALARAARKAIENTTPEISDINRLYGPIAELRDRLPQVANRIDNYNPFSLNTMLGAGFGGAAGSGLGGLGGLKGAIVGGLAGMANNPRVAAGTAIYLRGLQNNGLLGNFFDNSLLSSAIRQGLLQAGRLEEQQED